MSIAQDVQLQAPNGRVPSAEQTADQSFWAPGPTIDLASLDDQRLVWYRHPSEWRALVMIPVVLVVIGAILALFRPALSESINWAPRSIVSAILAVTGPWGYGVTVVVFFVGLAVVEVVSLWLQLGKIEATSVEITATTFPKFYPVVEELCARFQLPSTRFFALRGGQFGSMALGLRAPYLVLINASLIRLYTPEEFKFVVGHELGHIKMGHTRLAMLLGNAHTRLPGGLDWLNRLRSLITAGYQRSQERSADRAGVLATRDVNPGVAVCFKETLGRMKGARLGVLTLTPQARDLRHGTSAAAGWVSQLFETRPSLIYRLLELTRWAGLPTEADEEDEPPRRSSRTRRPAADTDD